MTQYETTLLNLGESLDDLANLDPRGYGVCKLLYKAARDFTGEPLCVNGARKLKEALGKDSLVYIMTGFVLHPFNKAETDGAVGSVLLARALVKAFGAKTVIICPEECINAVSHIAECLGLASCSVYVYPFTKDKALASECADKILSRGVPDAVVAVECPGENAKGVYHNAKGIDVTHLEAKQDILFEKLRAMGVPNIAIGDLGNEIGLGAIGGYIREKIPFAGESKCSCGCEGGICVRTEADNIITATVSDWGCYSLIAMLAFILENPDIMHGADIEKTALDTAVRHGLIDMTGEGVSAIDGFDADIICPIVTLMKELVCSALNLRETCKTWFEKTAELKSFE